MEGEKKEMTILRNMPNSAHATTAVFRMATRRQRKYRHKNTYAMSVAPLGALGTFDTALNGSSACTRQPLFLFFSFSFEEA